MKITSRKISALSAAFLVLFTLSSCLSSDNDNTYWDSNFLELLDGHWTVSAVSGSEEAQKEQEGWNYVFNLGRSDYKYRTSLASPAKKDDDKTEYIVHAAAQYTPQNLFYLATWKSHNDYLNDSNPTLYSFSPINYPSDELHLAGTNNSIEISLSLNKIKSGDFGEIVGHWVQEVPNSESTKTSVLELEFEKETHKYNVIRRVRSYTPEGDEMIEEENFSGIYNPKNGIIELFKIENSEVVESHVADVYIIQYKDRDNKDLALLTINGPIHMIKK